MLRFLLIVIFMVIIPFMLGNWWIASKNSIDITDIINSYMLGYYEMLATFQIISVPFCFMKLSFNLLCILHTILIVLLSTATALISYKKTRRKKVLFTTGGFKLRKIEWVYLIIAIVLLVLQLYYAIFYSTTYMSYDDATYLAYANSAIHDNRMYMNNVVTGEAQALDYQRALQTSIIFVAYLSKLTMNNVPTMAHTIMTVQLILMAYSVYYLMSRQLFKRTDNRLIFIILVEILYIFGYYSHYSMTFRLLGPVWQGKAIFAVVMTPYLFTCMPTIMKEPYNIRNGIILILLSTAASALSLAGSGTMVVILVIIGLLLVLFVYKKYCNLLYLLWGSITPGIYMAMYLLLR